MSSSSMLVLTLESLLTVEARCEIRHLSFWYTCPHHRFLMTWQICTLNSEHCTLSRLNKSIERSIYLLIVLIFIALSFLEIESSLHRSIDQTMVSLDHCSWGTMGFRMIQTVINDLRDQTMIVQTMLDHNNCQIGLVYFG